MTDTLISIRNLKVHFPKSQKPAFENLCIDIKKNTIFGIFGETGCGKTTLAKCIAGFLSPDIISGEIWLHQQQKIALHQQTQSFFQKNIRGKKIVYVPQDPYQTLNPFEKIETQLQRIITLAQNPKSVDEVLTQVELPLEKKKLKPHSLSAGQRQRATIALAMARAPQILIFDEPTASLDRSTRKRLLDFFSQLVAQKQVTILVISHEILDYEHLIEKENRLYFHQYDEDHTIVKRPTPATKNVLLETKEIQKSYGSQVILQQINLRITNGSWIYLEGKNGSGKSTLMHILSGLLSPDKGAILWREQQVQIKQYQKYIHLVFQDSFHSLNPRETVKQLLSEVIQCDKEHQAILEKFSSKWYKLLEIPESVFTSRAHQISYGQQKRVVLLRTLLKYQLYTLREPQQYHIFLLDEIFAGIHLPLRYKIMSLFVEMFEEKQNFSILWIAHGQDQLRNHCDEQYLLHEGTIQTSISSVG